MKQWEKLAEHLRREPALASRNTAEVLREAFLEGRAAIVLDGDEIVATTVIWPSPHGRWWEIGTVWSHPGYAGQRLGRKVFLAALKMLEDLPGDGEFLIADPNGKVAEYAESAGWVRAAWNTTTIPAEAIHGRQHRPGYDPAKRQLFYHDRRAALRQSVSPTRPFIGEQQIGAE